MSHEIDLEDISSRIVAIENNILDQEGYNISLIENNEENDLHHIIDFVGNNDSRILRSCIKQIYMNQGKIYTWSWSLPSTISQIIMVV